MNEVFVVDVLNPANHLVCQHEHGLHGEAAGAEVEQVLQRGSEQIHDQHIVVAFLAVPADVRDSHAALQDFVQLRLVEKLGMTGFDALKLHGDLLSVGDIDPQVDITETSASNLPYQSVLSTDDKLRAGGGGSAGHLARFFRTLRAC